MTGRSYDITLVLLPRFPLLSLAICTEAMRVANRELGRAAFRRCLATPDGMPVTSSSGLAMAPEVALSDIHSAPYVILLASYQAEEAETPGLLHWLRRQDRQGAFIAAVDNAAYFLARAGLLAGQGVAAHRESLPAYDALFDGATVLDRTYTLGARRATSAGGMATVDMVLALIEHLESKRLADRTAHILNHRRIAEGAPLDAAEEGGIARIDRRLARMVEMMQGHLDRPLPLEAICRAAHIDPSTARRLFRRRFGVAPRAYYLKLRLEWGRSLLTTSALSIAEIAERTGFADPSSFARAHKRAYGALPSQSRTAPAG